MGVLTKFSKGVPTSAGLSFSRSASANCDKQCKQFNNGFYAERVEKLYPSYGRKLLRHGRTLPQNLIYAALAEVRERRLTWFRFSVSGSVPSVNRLKDRAKFETALRELVSYLVSRKILIHFPVESFAKARMIRSMLKGLPVVVRRSCQTWRGLLRSKDQVSWVVPRSQDPMQVADTLREAGFSTVVCPAILRSSKCGKCKACASPLVDIVLYPKHR